MGRDHPQRPPILREQAVRLNRQIGYLSGLIALVVAMTVPAGYIGFALHYESAELAGNVIDQAKRVSLFVYKHPNLWRYQRRRIESIVSPKQHLGDLIRVDLRDNSGAVIADKGTPPPPPTWTRTAAIFDGAKRVGTLTSTKSLRPILVNASLLALFSALLGIAIFFVSRLVPSRVLRHAFDRLAAADAASRKSEARLVSAQRIAAIGDWEWDVERDTLFCSKQLLRILGLSSDEAAFPMARFLDHVPPTDRSRARDALLTARTTGKPYEITHRVTRADGVERILTIRGEPIRDEAGRVKAIDGVAQDITERVRAQRAAREGEERLSAIFNNSPSAMLLKDRAGRYLLVSSQFTKWYGIAAAAVIGKTAHDIFPAETADSVTAHDRDVLQALRAIEREHEVLFPDGSRHIMSLTKFPVFDGDGAVLGIGNITVDVTERKRAEDRLRLQAQIIDQIHDSVIAVDRNNLITLWNLGAERLFGYTEEEILGKPIFTIHPEDTREFLATHVIAPTEEKGWHTVEVKMRGKTGEPIDGLLSLSLLRNAKDAVVGRIGYTIDITAHKRAEEAVRESEARFRALAENSPEAIFLTDLDGRYRMINPRFAEWYGVSAKNILGKTAHDLFPKDRADAYAAHNQEVATCLAPIQKEHDATFADGSIHRIIAVAFPVFDAAGRLIGIGAINTDITERRQIETELRQAQKMEAVGQLTGGVAHDFNNLLAVIIGNIELLEEKLKGDPALKDMAGRALGAAERGAELTYRLLAFSRKQALRPRAIDINQLVADMDAMLRRSLGEAIDIETVADRDLWACEVDPAQMESVLLNLALNARDAMPDGGRLLIRTANATLDAAAADQIEIAPGRYVTLVVSDTGTGMSPEVASHAVEPFFTTKDVGQGSGLGLSVAYGFIQQSKGQMRIYSEDGHGTTIKIFVPVAEHATATQVEQRPSDKTLRGKGETILLVEDDAAVLALVLSLLEGLNYTVITAQSGPAALALLKDHPELDLLLTDVILPKNMSGHDLAQKVLRLYPQLRILYMSGYTRETIVHNGRLDENAILLEKPFRRQDVARKIREILDSGRS